MEWLEKNGTAVIFKRVKQRGGKDGWLQRVLLLGLIGIFLLLLILPLYQLFIRAFYSKDGAFVGLENFVQYFSSPTLVQSLKNTIFISSATMIISVTLAFIYAYALVRSAIPGKGFFKAVALLPLFAPTMMHGIALVYLFGHQGFITNGFWGSIPGISFELYGPVGIIMAEVIYTFPQALLILLVAFRGTDYQMYEAADTLHASSLKKFLIITMPNVKYGVISASFVVFTLSFTDFGAPKIVGGQYNVLATDVYKQVIGQQNIAMGATVGIILMLPAVFAFVVDRLTQQKHAASISAKSKPFQIKKGWLRDSGLFLFCLSIMLFVLLMVSAVLVAAFTKVWPYDLGFTLEHLGFSNYTGNGIESFKNSFLVAVMTAVIGTCLTFLFAYGIEKIRRLSSLRKIGYFLSIIPLAVPGLVIGLGYIFFFSQPEIEFFTWKFSNPFHFLYGTFAIIVMANMIHFYSVAFVTATTALKKLDKEYEVVSESMGVPFYKTFFTITVPMCLPAILEMALYFFVNSMVTISAVMFLYSPEFKLAAISIVNMDDAGNLAAAAAMSSLILLTNIAVKVLHEIITKILHLRVSRWQQR
ncbi:putative 2-aminoethylphosphonate ABC transporter permease subunit [Pseudobacillus wudalianchiensis]|uniref:Phosphonate ABC transporter permease n=1 Tax=Pseudobacillus wudalianchiensis TaxID=1743143 RepID=A0A1B9B839_9BACI|nr:putative 2-aminoethylphosphonate ABC transporter permease subunit [Bacillus wudalianchiensis]OCA92258.1 phosphonate ABC transporter permease [Bacillus wudalianchiensis]